MMMMPVIEARAQLATIDAIGLAMGSADDPARVEAIGKLRALASREAPTVEPGRREMRPDELAAMGIGMTIVGPDGKPAEAGAAHV